MEAVRGWIDGANISLNPESAYKAASDMDNRIGDTITTSERMLKNFLVQDETLASTGLTTPEKRSLLGNN
jgi:hypothetical protein